VSRCIWCGSTRHPTLACHQRARDLAVAEADAGATDPTPHERSWRDDLRALCSVLDAALRREAA
jgi:hypothetical protein